MSTRKFNDIEYAVPGVDTAIKLLRPGARWEYATGSSGLNFTIWEDDEGREPPTQEEIEEEVKREVNVYNYYLYERNREKEYPSIKDQLDMLFHDVENGNMQNGQWVQTIRGIKEKHSKPDIPIT